MCPPILNECGVNLCLPRGVLCLAMNRRKLRNVSACTLLFGKMLSVNSPFRASKNRIFTGQNLDQNFEMPDNFEKNANAIGWYLDENVK